MIKKRKTNIISGNFENKYESRNLVSKYLVNNFLREFNYLLIQIGHAPKILEIGSGEGYLVDQIVNSFAESEIIATDLCGDVLKIAKKRLKGYKNVFIKRENAEKLSFDSESMDLIVCCEVLEHLNDPKKALYEINRVLKIGGYVLISVPREPIWRILNMLRFRYVDSLGNTPGHLNHWSYSGFLRFLNNFDFRITEIKKPFPWTMVLLQK